MTLPEAVDESALLRAQLAALEQLLGVHEQTSLEQATRLEEALRARDELLRRDREALRALQLSEQRLRLALDAGSMGTWEWDIEGNAVIWSPEQEALCGLAPGSFSGTLAQYQEIVHPEDRERALSAAEDALTRKSADHHVVHRIVRPDGEVRWLEAHGHFVYAPDGRPERLVGVSMDVTDRRLAVRALREREEEFRNIANSLPQLAWMTDAHGGITWYNERWYEFTGTSFDDVKGWGWIAVHHPEHVDRVTRRFRTAIESESEWEDTFPMRGANGEYRWFLSRALPIRDPDGKVSRWFGTNTDVTAQREVEDARDRALAEAKLERQRLADVFMQAPAAIAVLEGPEHTFTVANPLYQGLVGERPLIGLPVRHALPEIEGQGFFELLDEVFRSGKAYSANESLARLDRDGDGVLDDTYIDFVYQPLTDGSGATFGIMVHAIDVTDRVLARQRIESLAAERSAILGQIADVVITTDMAGAITFANSAAAGIYGEVREGVPIWDPSQHFTLLGADGLPRRPADTPLSRAVHGERVMDEEWRVRRQDGSELVVLGSAVPVHGQDGAQLGAVMTVRDVTAQRRLQVQVEHERQQLQQILMEAPASITVTEGPGHVIIMQNAVSRQLVGGRSLLGLRAHDVFPEIAESGLVAIQDKVFATGEAYQGHEVFVPFDRDGDGEVEDGYFNFVYQPLHDEAGAVYGILTHAVEVTDQVFARRQVEEKADELMRLSLELERSNRDLDQFAYVASHDLKAPLRGIANLTEWIEEDLGDRVTGESREHMSLLKGRVNRMEALIDGVLAYSRAGRVRENPAPVDVAALLTETIELLAPPPGTEVVVGPGMPTIMTERIPLQQVLLNLVGNAIKYNPRDGARVEVTVRQDGGWYQFSIADNGPGIAAQYRERIWQIFQTLAARDKVEGTGIGLSVVRKIVEARGGRTWLDSEVGAGSTFHFTWPHQPETMP